MKSYYIYLLIFIIIYKCFTIKEGFSGFHDVNTVVRYMRRCNDAISTLKTGLKNAFTIMIPKKNGETCNKNYECSDKCVCQQEKCICVPPPA